VLMVPIIEDLRQQCLAVLVFDAACDR